MRKFLSVIALFICSSAVLAEDYYWTLDWDQKRYGSFSEACSVFSAAMIKNNPQGGLTLSVAKVNATTVACQMKSPQGGTPYTGSVVRSGGGCTAPKTYNEATGACDDPPPPPPDCSKAGPNIFKGPDVPVMEYNGRRTAASFLTGPLCYEGCSYDLNERAASCYANGDAEDTGFCNFSGKANGAACSGPNAEKGGTGGSLNPGPPPENPNPDEPPSDPDDPKCPPPTIWNGTFCSFPGDGGDDGGGGNNGGGGGGNDGGGDGGGDNGGGGGDGDGSDGGGTGGDDGGSGGDDGGSGGDDGGGDGGGPEEDCRGDRCDFLEGKPFGKKPIGTFSQSFDKIWKGVSASPIGQSLGRITVPSGGSCPTQSVQLFGKSIAFTEHCTLWNQIQPILSAVFLAVWALLAVRIFLSA